MGTFFGFSLIFMLFLELLAAEPMVTVSNGDILGTEISHDGRVIEVYKGIPYAKPPIGPLRFKKPEPAENWQADGVLDATRYGPSCIQFIAIFSLLLNLENPEVSEDCLTLNVFAPTDSSESSLAVMVWIHGGGFDGGQAQAFDPRDMVAKGDIIVVTVNYRLGPLGFLSTGDENAPGNYALWDQLLAIQWVKDNAAAFGGDPHRLTIFGRSAGSWSVSTLVLSPKSQGLFQRAISQSGMMIDDLLQVNSLKEARALADRLNCMEDDTALLVECLRSVSVEDMVQYNVPTFSKIVVDGEILPNLPSKLNDIGKFDYMIGFVELEGFAFSTNIIDITSPTNQGISEDLFEKTINSTITNGFPSLFDNACELQKVIDAATFVYTHWEDLDNDQERLVNLVSFLGDTLIVVPSVEMARRHRSESGTGTTYLYYFTYKSSNPVVFDPVVAFYDPTWNDKATHADELPFLFYPALFPIFNDADRRVSETLATYWSNFARTGNPNEPNNANIPEWKQHGEEGEYIELGEFAVTGQDMTDLDPEHVSFWLELVPTLTENTSCPSEKQFFGRGKQRKPKQPVPTMKRKKYSWPKLRVHRKKQGRKHRKPRQHLGA